MRRIVADEKAELVDQSKAVHRAPGWWCKSRARVRFADGEDATLVVDDEGAFRIATADALPAGARSPEQALEQLRRVLARRSYAGLMRVLSPATRSAIESDLRSLVIGLEHPEGLEVNVAGDAATVQNPRGSRGEAPARGRACGTSRISIEPALHTPALLGERSAPHALPPSRASL